MFLRINTRVKGRYIEVSPLQKTACHITMGDTTVMDKDTQHRHCTSKIVNELPTPFIISRALTANQKSPFIKSGKQSRHPQET